MNGREWYYAFPEGIFFIFFVLAFVAFSFLLFRYRKKLLQGLAEPSLLQTILKDRSQVVFWVKIVGLCLVWILGTLALMQPTAYGEYPQELRQQKQQMSTGTGKQRSPHDILFLIDASASMGIKDAQSGQSRLEYAKDIVDQVIGRLQGQTVALNAFTSDVTQLSPLTLDYLFIRLALRQIEINEGGVAGTDISHALKTLKERYFLKDTLVPITVIILTDGGDTKLEALSGVQKQQGIQDIAALFDKEASHVRVLTVGLGANKGSPVPNVVYSGKPVISALDEELLVQMAKEGKGAYFSANEFSSIGLTEALLKAIEKEEIVTEAPSTSAQDTLIHRLYYQIFLGLAILILAAILIVPDTWARRTLGIKAIFLFMTLFGFPSLVYAETQYEMLQAQAFLEVGDYASAKEEYQRLLQKDLKPWQRAILLYDLGTVWLVQQEASQAVKVLQTVPLVDNSSPLLHYRVAHNLLLALLEKASSPDASSKDVEESMSQAFALIPILTMARCAREKAEGLSTCSSSDDLKRLKTYLEQQRALLSKQATINAITHAPIKEHLERLSQGLQEALTHLDFLERAEMSDELKQQYQEMFWSEIGAWVPVWRSTFQKFKVDEKNNAKHILLFNSAATDFLQGLAQWEQLQIQESMTLFKASDQKLKELMQMPPPPSSSPQPEEKPPEPPPSSSPEQKRSNSTEQVLQMLLEMEQADRMQPKKPIVPKSDVRPW
ncbi:MAG: VWA domain-containing protein [Parachlamydiaceae bacterium]|nr:VWA domain-containing protein [Parachlamydiaceae bacterium]